MTCQILQKQFHLFADDTNIYYSSRSLELIQFTLIENLNSISQWLHANNLALNNEKNNCHFLFLQESHISKHSYSLTDKPITEENCVRYLGLLIDSNLSWKIHIHELLKNRSCMVYWYISQTETLCPY